VTGCCLSSQNHMAEITISTTGIEVSIVPYTPDHETFWDQFVRYSSRNGTLLHTRRFLQHNVLSIRNDASLLFFFKGKLIAILPATIENRGGKLTLNSHQYSTYGGLVVGMHTTFRLLERCIQLLIAYAKYHDIVEMIIRQPPRIYHNYLSDEIDYVLWKCGFQMKFRECELALDLTGAFVAHYKKSKKRNIAKALRDGIMVKISTDYAAFWRILTANLRDKHQVNPVHSLAQMQKLIELTGNAITLFGCYLQGELIGGVLLFVANERVVHAQYIASDRRFQQHRAVDALIDHIAGWAKNQGFRYFNLGMANEPGGKLVNESLFRFKEGFGALGTSRDTVHILFNT
jgi:hypothetical protein